MNKKKTRVGVIGAGHLGKHHIKHLANHGEIEFIGAFDKNKSALNKVCEEFSVKALDSIDQLIFQCDAVNIVTPTDTHFDIAKKFLDERHIKN